MQTPIRDAALWAVFEACENVVPCAPAPLSLSWFVRSCNSVTFINLVFLASDLRAYSYGDLGGNLRDDGRLSYFKDTGLRRLLSGDWVKLGLVA